MVTASAFLVVPPKGVAPPLELFLLVISLRLYVTLCWDVGKVDGVWTMFLVLVLQNLLFVLVQPALCWSVLEVHLVGSVVDYLSVSILD